MRVLVVEDEKKIAALVCKALTESGYAVDELHRGDEALDALRETPYDVAVLDIMLPGLDGLSVLRAYGPNPIQSRYSCSQHGVKLPIK